MQKRIDEIDWKKLDGSVEIEGTFWVAYEHINHPDAYFSEEGKRISMCWLNFHEDHYELQDLEEQASLVPYEDVVPLFYAEISKPALPESACNTARDKPKIVQILIGPEDAKYQGRLLGLDDQGNVWGAGSEGWEPWIQYDAFGSFVA